MKKTQTHLILKAISLVTHPVFVFPILIVLYFDWQQLPSFLVVFFFSFVLPFCYFLYLYKNKRIKDFDVTIRKERYRLYYITAVGLLTSALYLFIFSTSEVFINFSLLLLIAVLIIGVNFKIKVSIHVALITILCFSLLNDFGLHPLVFTIIPIVAYSRLKLKRHTATELLFGFLIPTLFYIWR
jgi:hypothetical protein